MLDLFSFAASTQGSGRATSDEPPVPRRRLLSVMLIHSRCCRDSSEKLPTRNTLPLPSAGCCAAILRPTGSVAWGLGGSPQPHSGRGHESGTAPGRNNAETRGFVRYGLGLMASSTTSHQLPTL